MGECCITWQPWRRQRPKMAQGRTAEVEVKAVLLLIVRLLRDRGADLAI